MSSTSSYLDFTHLAKVADEPGATLNPTAAAAGQPFVKVDLGPVAVTIHDPVHAERIAAVFAEAARLQREALAALDKPGAES